MLIDWLNSENTPKVLFQDERMAELRSDGSIISQIQLGIGQLGREGSGNCLLKVGRCNGKGDLEKLREKT